MRPSQLRTTKQHAFSASCSSVPTSDPFKATDQLTLTGCIRYQCRSNKEHYAHSSPHNVDPCFLTLVFQAGFFLCLSFILPRHNKRLRVRLLLMLYASATSSLRNVEAKDSTLALFCSFRLPLTDSFSLPTSASVSLSRLSPLLELALLLSSSFIRSFLKKRASETDKKRRCSLSEALSQNQRLRDADDKSQAKRSNLFA